MASASLKSEEVNKCDCVVCYLLKERFSASSFGEQLKIIENGRPKPSLKHLKTKIKSCTRRFNVELYENRNEWLTGCEILCKLFCWPCLLFSQEKGVWNKSGFCDLNNIHKEIKRHAIYQPHLEAVIKVKLFGKVRIEHAIDHQLKISYREHNELVDKNRAILKRFIDVVCFLGEHELGFGDHNESARSTSGGNFIDLIHLLSKYDAALKSHLEQSNAFRETSNRIQNDLISSVAAVVVEKIKREIEQASFVAILVEEAVDTTNLNHLSMVIRYVKSDGSIQERFLGFLDVTVKRTAESLYKHIYDVIEDLECGVKLVSQSYDEAAVMADHLGRLQAKVRESFPGALFIYCFAHRLNVVLAQSVGHINECKIFFSIVSGMADFFSKSTKRSRALDLVVQTRLPKASPTKWNYDGKLVLMVYEYRQDLIKLFENILENSHDWDFETLDSSQAYLDILKGDFNFNFLLNIFFEIFPLTDDLFDILQNRFNDVGFCTTKIEHFKNFIEGKRNNFLHFWENTSIKDGLEPQRKRKRVDDEEDLKTSYFILLNKIIDQIVGQLNYRFSNLNTLKFIELCNFTEFKNKPFPENAFQSLKTNYGNYFDLAALRSELIVIYLTDDVNKKTNAAELLEFIQENGLSNAYWEVMKLCQLVLTIAATSASVESSFSALKRIKKFVRNSTKEERLSKFSILSIEKNLIKEMSEHPQFYENVIAEFAKKDRRIELHHK